MRRHPLTTTALSCVIAASLGGTAYAAASGTGKAPTTGAANANASSGGAAANVHGTTPSTSSGNAGGNSSANANGANTNAAGGATTAQGTGVVALPPKADPVAGKDVDVEANSGSVTVRLPGTNTYIPLSQASSIPVGTVIDATHGVVTLTSVKHGSVTQSADFWGSKFRVEQNAGAHPVTVLALTGNLGCPTPGAHARTAISAASAHIRSLWGHDHHGSFRTRGRAGAATVRGTVWLTQDTCAGTLFRVTHGAIVVHDRGRHANVKVTAGHSYLARLHK